jgi:hypothetical protein
MSDKYFYSEELGYYAGELHRESDEELTEAEWTYAVEHNGNERRRFDADPIKGADSYCNIVGLTLEQRLKAGFLHSDGNTYPIDQGAQIAFTAMLQALDSGISVPMIVARTVDNQNIVMTEPDFRVFVQAVLNAGFAMNGASWAAKDAIRAAPDFDTAWAAYQGYMA